MADQLDWGSEAKEQPKPKRRIPVWAWFCGGGCVLALITAIVAAIAFGSFVSNMTDPDEQWKQLESVVAVQERPQGDIFGMKIPLQDMRVISIQQGTTKVDFMIAGGKAGDELRTQFLDPDAKGGFSPLGNVGRHGVEELVLSVQGRELRGVRYTTVPREGNESEPEPTVDENGQEVDPADMSVGDAVRMALRTSITALDITPEGSGRVVLMQYSHLNSLEPIPDSEVLEFLRHFDLTKQP
ncbi:MAG: hypothetical protein HUU28_07835 [Planctomycetaceae bacterium]|jgi:hypothetical protein|nr:hypothetical protein [Planctomycetaceae bacterium]